MPPSRVTGILIFGPMVSPVWWAGASLPPPGPVVQALPQWYLPNTHLTHSAAPPPPPPRADPALSGTQHSPVLCLKGTRGYPTPSLGDCQPCKLLQSAVLRKILRKKKVFRIFFSNVFSNFFCNFFARGFQKNSRKGPPTASNRFVPARICLPIAFPSALEPRSALQGLQAAPLPRPPPRRSSTCPSGASCWGAACARCTRPRR